MAKMTRREYAAMYGPTKGDAVRLGDTSLLAEIEHDYAVPGDECLHGGGKTLRDGMGLKAGYSGAQGALDMLICNATIIDPVLGIVKGDIGIRDGKIVAIGKAGNPESMDGVHVHFDSAQLCEHAIASGLTTLIGGSLGPITVGIDCGGEWNVGKMLQASQQWPMNFGFLGRGNSSKARSLYDQLRGGCLGLKI